MRVSPMLGGSVQFHCLGPLRVTDGERELPLGPPQQRLVLATLLMHAGEDVAADRLVDAVWDGDRPASGRASLHTYVSRLRKVTGPQRLISRGRSYRLDVAAEQFDARRFERLLVTGRRLRDDPPAAARTLREALDLWTGPPYADLADASALRPEITRLEELRLVAIEERIAADLNGQMDAELVGELEALLTAHPLRERLWASLMLALYRSGRQAEALGAYERARATLVEALGLDPSADLQRLHMRMLRHDPTLDRAVATLKGYRLLERIMEDRWWTAWRATHPGSDGKFVVRVAAAHLADTADFIRSFTPRVQQISDVAHPHVAVIHDFWREPGEACVVERRWPGRDLDDVLAADPDRSTRLRLALQLTDAVAAAHRRGVAHGALTGAAVRVDESGDVVLTGFAIALTSPVGVEQQPLTGWEAAARRDVDHLGVLLTALLPDTVELTSPGKGADPSRPADATELLAAVRRLTTEAGGAQNRQLRTAPRRNPYKGLRAFTESDHDDFFGREDAVSRLLVLLAERNMVTVVGPSGSGKSSVVRAGLVPALRAGALPGSSSWYVASMLPGEDPFESLGSALRQLAVEPGADLAGQLRAEGLVATAAGALADGHELLLVLDQMEELFTLTDERMRQDFVALLADAAAVANMHVVGTLRADFYDRPLADTTLAPWVRDGTCTVVPMNTAELEQAIVGPAKRVGLEVDSALVMQMVADVVDQPGALPLVQYALTELYDASAGQFLSLDDYRRIGGVAGAVAHRAEEAYGSLSPNGQRAARQLLLRLVNPGPRGERTRSRVRVDDVATVATDEMPHVLKALGAARLLTFDRDPDSRAPTVEIAHEALLREWDRLRGWLDEAEQHIIMQRRLQRATADWEAADQDPSYLATGSQLEQYEGWRRQVMTPTTGEAAYLDASVAHRQRMTAVETERREREAAMEARANRRLRVLVGVLAVAAVVGGVLTVLAVTLADRAADRAQVANARELAAAAMSNLDADAERSLLLALEAVDVSRSAGRDVVPEAAEALHAAITASRVHMRIPSHSGLVDWHPGGTRFAMEGAEAGRVEVRDAETGALVASWVPYGGPLRALHYAPDGSVVATGDDGHAAVWNGPQELLADLSMGDGHVTGVSTSADGGLLAAAWPLEDVVRVFSLPVGVLLQEIAVEAPTATSFARNGNWLVIGRRFGYDVYSGLDDEATRALAPRSSWTGETSFGVPTPTGEADERWKLVLRGNGGTPDVAFGQDGGYLVLGGEEAVMEDLDATDGTVWFERSPGAPGAVGTTAYGVLPGVTTLDWPDKSLSLATASRDGFVQVWTVDGTSVELTTTISSADTVSGLDAVALRADGQRLLAGSAGARSVVMWDLSLSGTAHLTNMRVRPGASGATAVGGGRVLMPDVDDLAAVRDSRSGRVIDRVGPGQVPDRMVAADPAGRLVAAIVSARRVFVYAADGEEPLWVGPWVKPQIATDRRRPATAVGVSAQHRVLVQDESGAVHVYDREGEEVAQLGDPEGFGGSLAVGGGRVAAAQDVAGTPAVTVWDVATTTELARFEGVATAVDLSDDGTLLAMAGDRTVTIRDVSSGETVAELPQPSGVVAAVAMSHGGRQVVTGSADGLVRLFDLTSGGAPVALRGHDAPVTTVAWASGTVVVSGDSDGLFRSWETDLDAAGEIARREVAREFTDEECRQFLRLERCPADGS